MGGGVTVLVVDDDAAIRLLCRINLEHEGYRVLDAGSLPAARAELERGPIHLVLVDVHVGGDDGRTFVEELRRERPELPVAFLTGTADPAELERIGADAVVGKPFELTDLIGTVRRLAGRR